MGFLGSLVNRKKPAVGLDIGGSSVKVVKMAKAGDGYQLSQYGVMPVGLTFNEEGSAVDSDRTEVVNAIRRLFAEKKIATRHVVSAVSGESVIVRIIRMPHIEGGKASDLEFAVKNEARDFIPFEMEDVVFDYQRLDDVVIDGQKSMEVLVVAVKKELIEDHIRLLNEAGLEPVVIDVGSFALVNTLIAAQAVAANEAVALVNIGADVTSIAVMRNAMTRFTRDFSTAGRNITNALIAELGVAWAQAEELKMRHGILLDAQPADDLSFGDGLAPMGQSSLELVRDLSDAISEIASDPVGGGAEPEADMAASRVSDICKQVISDIASEVKRSLLYYENQLDGESVSRVILSGGTARMNNIAPYFEQLLDIPTETLKVLDRFGRDGDAMAGECPMMGVGMGLALRNVI